VNKVSARTKQGLQARRDNGKPRTKWPADVMKTAAAMVVEQHLTALQVARELKIPYTTVSDWARRYREDGTFEARPRRSAAVRRSPLVSKIDPRRQAVIDVKHAQPHAGARRIRDVVKRFFGLGTSETTVRRVLKDEGLAQKREPGKPKAQPKVKRFERAEPNQLWQSDLFTFLLRKHERVYVAAFMDDHSRYLVSLVMAHHQKSSLVMEALERGIADYGAPREILTDQGRQYTAWRGSTAFEEELRRHGIAHVKSRPHHPQTCGKIERFWKTMWEEFLSRTVFADFDDCQRRSMLFVQHYNFQRPHQGLEGLTPADRFFRSAPQVRAAIESTVAANALRLSKEQPARPPFYLVGRLGDRDLAINASGTGLKVRVGNEETTIALREGEHEQARTTRWIGAKAVEEAATPADPEMVEGSRAAQCDREEPLPHAALGSIGGEAGDGSHRGSQDLARHLLSDGDACAACDARGTQSDPGGSEERGAGPSSEDPGAQRAHPQARAGQASHPAAAAAHEEVGLGAAHGAVARTPSEECLAGLDAEWERFLGELGDEPGDDQPFDPDEGWRERVLSEERKLAGFEAVESAHGQETLYAGAEGSAPGDSTLRADAGGDGGSQDGDERGQRARHVAQSLPDADASRACRDGGIDRAAACGTPREAARDGRDANADRTAQAREREVAEPRGHDRQVASGREQLAARAHSSGAPGEETQEGGRQE